VIRSILRLSLVLSLVIGTVAPVSAGDTAPVLSRIVASGELKVGMSGTQPPFTVKAKTGKLMGFEVDLANLLANTMGVELKIVQKPFGDLLPALEKGEVDLVMSGMTITPARNLRAAFVGPYIITGKSILTSASTLERLNEAEKINQGDITLAALKGSTSQRFVERVLPKAKLVATEDYDAAVGLLRAGDADAVVADYSICAISVLRYPDDNLATLVEPLTIEPIGVAVSPGDSLLLNMLENYLGALEAVGVLEKLEQKWFDDGAWLIQLP